MQNSEIKSHEALLTPTSEGFNANGLKLVKNASIFLDNGIVFIRHYETIIFAHDMSKGTTEANWYCSTTSDRQIRNALKFFGIPDKAVVNVHKGEKWNYSGALV